MIDYSEALLHYDKLISSDPTIERKGKTMPYTSINGHMFSFLSKQGEMGLRLSKEDLEVFIQEHKTKQMEQHDRVMKEFVLVPGQLLVDAELMSIYLKKSIVYTSSLKPKTIKK